MFGPTAALSAACSYRCYVMPAASNLAGPLSAPLCQISHSQTEMHGGGMTRSLRGNTIVSSKHVLADTHDSSVFLTATSTDARATAAVALALACCSTGCITLGGISHQPMPYPVHQHTNTSSSCQDIALCFAILSTTASDGLCRFHSYKQPQRLLIWDNASQVS